MIKKLITLATLSSLLISGAALAGWSEYRSYSSYSGYGWHHHHHWYPHHYHHYRHYDRGNNLAAGLLVGGVVGVLAGSAIANSYSQPTYVNNTYYTSAPRSCYKEKVWSRKICNAEGCFIKTKWANHCY